MAIPILSLNLAPRPSLWRQQHTVLGWLTLGLGVAFLAGSIGFTWRAYHQADRAGREAVSLTTEAQRAARQEQQLQASLQDMDATREQSRWKLAERILQERSLPWSRLTAELEQCMVPDMRLKGIQRVRSNTQQVVMKLKGEARTREAEAAFVEALRKAPVFDQVILERESERTGGGWDFELSLPAAAVPPPFQVKITKTSTPAASAPVPPRPVGVPAPVKPPAIAHPLPITPTPSRPAGGLSAPGSSPSVVPRTVVEDDGEEHGSRRFRPRSPRRPVNPSAEGERLP
jgi:hypothetical protein